MRAQQDCDAVAARRAGCRGSMGRWVFTVAAGGRLGDDVLLSGGKQQPVRSKVSDLPCSLSLSPVSVIVCSTFNIKNVFRPHRVPVLTQLYDSICFSLHLSWFSPSVSTLYRPHYEQFL